jgi:integrase
MPRLTKRACDSAPVGTTWDSELPGFGLRVLASGRRSFIVRYRTTSGTERLVTLGTLAEIHPEEAREKAREIKRAARDGRDPKQERTAARHAPRLSDLRDRMLDEHCQQRKPRTREAYETAWRLHILPIIGNLPVADVSEADVLKIRRSLAATPTQANRVLACLSKAMNLAERWRWRPQHSNPCRHVDHYPESHRERILEADELRRLFAALDTCETVMESTRTLFRLLLLTGLRTGEWRLAQWSWLDEINQTLRIPHGGSKTGARNVPLSPDVMQILNGLPRSSVFILPGRTGGPMSGHQKSWRAICKAAGVEGVRIHDIRHTVGTYTHQAGATQREIADLLGHRQLSTTERYINGLGSAGHRNATRATATIIELATGQKKAG